MSPYYSDDTVTLHHGDALEVAKQLPPASVDCIVTSPPYFGLRDYEVHGQYGLESSPAEYVEALRSLFDELKRALSDVGTLWLNIGDTYRKKQLQGIPWRVALALQDDGWILRNAIVWDKPNALPESVRDRLANRYEQVFMFSKSPKYGFNLDSIRVPLLTDDPTNPSYRANGKSTKRRKKLDVPPGQGGQGIASGWARRVVTGKNPGDVWRISTRAFSGAHFAVMPHELARRAILAGCKRGGIVLDPFSGSGTTGMVAKELGRKYVGVDISEDYLKLSLETRLQNGVLDFGEIA